MTKQAPGQLRGHARLARPCMEVDMTNLIANKLTPQREALNLYRHGTLKWKLTPNVVYQTAVRDLESLEFNIWLRGECGRIKEKHGKNSPDYKNLPQSRGHGFLAKHVRKARTPAALLKFALEEHEEGLARAKNVNTLALYDDVDALAKAYVLACEAGA